MGCVGYEKGIKDVFEIGKRKEKAILVKMEKYEDKRKLMEKRMNMKGSGIFVDDDLTIKERTRQKEIRAWAKNERERGTTVKIEYNRAFKNGTKLNRNLVRGERLGELVRENAEWMDMDKSVCEEGKQEGKSDGGYNHRGERGARRGGICRYNRRHSRNDEWKRKKEREIEEIKTEKQEWDFINRGRKKREKICKQIELKEWEEYFMKNLEGSEINHGKMGARNEEEEEGDAIELTIKEVLNEVKKLKN
ncbi:WD repeat-containing protein 87-like, partial [Temnothorax curvispinosus]|uniref:WD repeat-containing protein 87-like n=1 Tax=Temnothorax curvispinosus TaxID=300111 RepID=A0A6J1Q903_9HYME